MSKLKSTLSVVPSGDKVATCQLPSVSMTGPTDSEDWGKCTLNIYNITYSRTYEVYFFAVIEDYIADPEEMAQLCEEQSWDFAEFLNSV